MITSELWLDVPNCDGRYKVSNTGKIAVKLLNGDFKGRKINYCTSYPSITITPVKNQRPITYYIHKLVAEVFIGKRPIGMIIRHLDGNRYNNSVENLSYGLPEENFKDDRKHKNRSGSRNGNSKLDERDVCIIKKLIAEDVSLSKIARCFAVTPSAINEIDKKRHWTDVI